jgi:hypothetical protein|tara:strand:+ start:345 stop:623 length:279 start_codon:yes stop_codon:yes gene_type:complete
MTDSLVSEHGTLDAVYDESLNVWRVYFHPSGSPNSMQKLWARFRDFADENNLDHTIRIQRKYPNYVVAWAKELKTKSVEEETSVSRTRNKIE